VNFDLQDADLLATQSPCSTDGTWSYVDTNTFAIGNFVGCSVDGDGFNSLASAQSPCNINSCPVQQYPPSFSAIYALSWSQDCNSFVATSDTTFQPNLYLSNAVYAPLVCRRIPKPVPQVPTPESITPSRAPTSFTVSAGASLLPIASLVALAFVSVFFFAM